MAVICWSASWALAVVGGILFSVFENIAWDKGIYWALTTVTTVGYGDVTPHNLAGYVIADCTMVLTIPIWSVAIAFATSWFTSWHIWSAHDRMKEHVTSEVTK
jgi:voltage-gated potassium channel